MAVDTGVASTVDPEQLAWLRAALDRIAREDRDGSCWVIRSMPADAIRAATTSPSQPSPDAARARRHDRDGGRHPRFRVLGSRHGKAAPARASLRQRRRRRVPELRHGARLAGAAAHARLGLLSHARRRVGRSIVARRSGSARPGGGRDGSARGRSRRRGCRPPSTTTSRPSSRASSKSASNPLQGASACGPGASMGGCDGPISRCRQIDARRCVIKRPCRMGCGRPRPVTNFSRFINKLG